MYTQLALCSILTAAAAAPAPASVYEGVVKVPVSRKHLAIRDNNSNVNPSWYFSQLQYTLNKYGLNVKFPFVVTDSLKRSVALEPLNDQVDSSVDDLYYGNVAIGTTSPQTFTVDFDTGSSDTFVPGPNCASGCVDTVRYNQKGQDEGNTTTVTYGSGSISGENYFDTMNVAGLEAAHSNVVSLTTATGFSGSNAEGLMGMAFSNIAESGQPTYFENLISQGVVQTPEFGFYLGRAADGSQSASELALGGRDSFKFTGKVTQVPVSKRGYWQVAHDTVIINGKTAPSIDPTKGQAAIDTGTTIILAPTLATASIYSRVPGSFPVPVSGSDLLLYAYPCSKTPTVKIQFAGRKFGINKKDFSLGTITSNFAMFIGDTALASRLASNSYCLGAIAGADIDPEENLYVVGDTFLKNWYSIFNFNNYKGKPSVSFAKAGFAG